LSLKQDQHRKTVLEKAENAASASGKVSLVPSCYRNTKQGCELMSYYHTWQTPTIVGGCLG